MPNIFFKRQWISHKIFITSIECHIDGLVQDCSNSSALAMELLQSYTKLSTPYGAAFRSCMYPNV